MKKKVVATVPMKGHSSRIPKKNMRLLCGKPMYHWVVEALLKVDEIEKIMINTDSDKILKDARTFFPDARVVAYKRPNFLLGDYVSMNSLIKYDMDMAGGEYFLQTHATNPLIMPETIKKAVNLYFDSLDTYDSLFTVNRLQVRLYHSDGRPVNHDPENPAHIHSQNIESIYEENSNIYVFSRSSFYANKERRYGLQPQMLEMDTSESIDVDYEHEFKIAEILMKIRAEGKSDD